LAVGARRGPAPAYFDQRTRSRIIANQGVIFPDCCSAASWALSTHLNYEISSRFGRIGSFSASRA
jgi:hypothetical protein